MNIEEVTITFFAWFMNVYNKFIIFYIIGYIFQIGFHNSIQCILCNFN